ncbi:alpha-2-macroglobulin family protein [Dysgonomonas gadei]|uniref:alpha-2-macroglobulin family protein n=1 Tax=Dysgonomonas gadei TaxID=156974 RepID=UPI003AF1C344
MKKQLLISLFFLLSISMIAQISNKKYENEWKQVEDYEQQSLPQSAAKSVDEILQKAISDKNTTQVVKALIYKNKYKKQIDRSDSEAIFTDLQALLSQTTNAEEKALLHSMLAELYSDYYNSNQWQINQRTNLQDVVPEDMKEWSSNIFMNKIIANLDLSVKDITALKQSTTKAYDDIILLGTDGQKYYPTLYDFLMERAIQIAKGIEAMGYREYDVTLTGASLEQLAAPADEYIKLNISAGADKRQVIYLHYQQYMKDLLSRNMIPTLVFTEIDKANYLSRNSRTLSGDKVLDIFIALEKKYENSEASTEIINKIVDSYSNMQIINSSFLDLQSTDINEKIYAWIKKGIDKYPASYGAKVLQARLNEMEYPSLTIKGNQLQYPKQPFQLTLIHKNLQALAEKPDFKLYKVENGKYNPVKDLQLNLISKVAYQQDTLSVDLSVLPVGKYSFSSRSKDSLENDNANDDLNLQINNTFDFTVSSLIALSRNSAKDEYEILVVDRITGKPVKDATVKIYTYEYPNSKTAQKLITILKTDALGLAVYNDKTITTDQYRYNIATYKVELGADSCLRAETLSAQNYRWNQILQDGDEEAISIFTDRNIYRPGQTVYFKAIAIDNGSKLLANEEYTVELYNANGESIAEKEIITNEFGSISGEFILPQTGLLGGYHIEIDDASAYFNVEEYKRPTFEITFDKVDKTYTFGEEVTLKGYAKNFSGISLQGADVKYNISREQFSFWYWRSGNTTPFTDGTVKTNDDGSFEITFTPEAGDGNRALLRSINDKQIYTFNITATVTDVNGETQSNTYTLTVGNVSMVINIDIPQQMEKASDYELKIAARNLQAQDIETSGTYEIYALDDNDSILIQGNVLSGSFKTGEQTELKARLKSLASGKYQLQVKALDSKSNEVGEKQNFVLYSYADKKPPVKTNEWLVTKNLLFEKDKPAEVIFGSSEKDSYILYQLYNNKKVFEKRFVKLSDANQTFTVPYKDEYGDELKMTFTSVRDGKLYNKEASLYKKTDLPDTQLNIKLEVFRDKLRPGQAETWTISVKDTTSQPILAELIASMYDTSLDKLYPYTAWSFNRPYISREYVTPVSYSFPGYSNDYTRWFNFYYKAQYDTSIPERTKDIINWFDYIYSYGRKNALGDIPRQYLNYSDDGVVVTAYAIQEKKLMTGSVSRVRAKNGIMIRGVASVAAPQGMLNESVVLADSAGGVEDLLDIGFKKDTDTPTPQIRQNFNETAFFFPQLRTNEKGETLISFTVPESNTTWRFRALAHDKDARVGTLEQMVVTRKELMVTPNMPRFVRQGDKTSISTKISNLSDKTLSGDVYIEFFDPATDKVIDLGLKSQKQTFSLEKDASTSVNWIFDVPAGIELIGCRIVAQNESFSDGEQHVLAVLSNRMLVTESMPIDMTKQGTSTFTFDKLYNNTSNTASNYRLTLEYASNPAWYAVQALPAMSNPSNENAVNWFASYYVNTLGSSIVRQYPKVASMIQAWQKQGADKQTLVSKLQKDEELKAVLLEETPWVLDAKDETEQMQRLSLLFDLNNTKQQTDAATRKLAELITNDGGWSWYKGLYPSRSVTQYILYGYANLQKTGQVEYPQEIKEMQIKALKYIDNQIAEDFKNLKKYNKDWEKVTTISTNQLEFAYVRSFYRDIPISQEARVAERFYTDLATRNWTKLNLYERSILSVVLKQNGEKEQANKIVKSIKEHAVKNVKLGMYWPNNRSNVFMSLSAISVHTFLMDALEQNGASKEEMDLMKRWLLNQKRTQVWESTHASIDAISALLSSGTDWFVTEPAPTAIKVGSQIVQPENKELGTGYFKQTWNKSEITNDMGKVEVTTSTSQPAYGAMYWQYYENLDKITVQKGDLNVSKELFKENVSVAGKGLTLITESNPLTVGDKVIVRLTVRTDRDMDFVQLKDMRAPCFEPQQTISGTRWAGGLIYYQMAKDASTNFYFDHLPKGTYVLEYPVYVNRTGEYANGITTIQCMYAPEFVSHTQGIKVTVKE